MSLMQVYPFLKIYLLSRKIHGSKSYIMLTLQNINMHLKLHHLQKSQQMFLMK
jgi:hypothetical protein